MFLLAARRSSTFGVRAAPASPSNHFRRWVAKPPNSWNGFCGRRCPREPKIRRFPAGPKTMYQNHKRIQSKPIDWQSHTFEKNGFRGPAILETWPPTPPFGVGLANPNAGGCSQDVSNKQEKPRRSESSSICHQTRFVSAVVSGLCPSAEFPVDGNTCT